MDAGASPADGAHPHPVLERVFGTVPGVRWLVGGIVLVSLAAAVLMRLIAEEDFPTFGEALWWSVQTVTTVGYGDVTPETTEGRAAASALMIAGVAAVSLVTAAIAAGFVNRLAARRRVAETDPVIHALERIEARLDELDLRLPGERPS